MLLLLLLLRCSFCFEWCQETVEKTEEFALRIPIAIRHISGESSVEFGIKRGEHPERAIVEFARDWQLGAWQEASLRGAVYEYIARKRVLLSELICIVFEADDCAVCPKDGTLLPIGADFSCTAFDKTLKVMGIATNLSNALFTIFNTKNVTTTTIFIARSSRILTDENVGEFVRLRHASEIDSLVLAVPDVNEITDHGVIANAVTLRKWWLPSAVEPPTYWTQRGFPFELELFLDQARLRGSLLRAWWLVASTLNKSKHTEDVLKTQDHIKYLECSQTKNQSFLVLTIEQGHTDTSTAGTFADVSASLAYGLRALGASVRTSRCTDALSCSSALSIPKELPIVLGAHNLQVFLDSSSNQPIVLTDHASLLLDPSRVLLYNFEHVNAKMLSMNLNNSPSILSDSAAMTTAAGSYFSSVTLEIFRRAHTVWDYSSSNIQELTQLGIRATHVPLGAAPPWHIDPDLKHSIISSSFLSGISEDDYGLIDVLFYGTLTPHRANILASLRASPAAVTIVHANAYSNGIFGVSLDAMILDAKIVLNLQAFDNDDEWKMPRLARLLANEKFIISQGSCSKASDQCWPFREGIVFSPLSRLKETILFFLSRPQARRTIARRGLQTFEAMSYADILHDPVCQLFSSKKDFLS